MELHILELPKFKDEENEVLKRAMEELEYLSGDEDFQRLVEAREKAIRDEVSFREEARIEGKIEGEIEGKIEGEIEGEKEGEIKGEEKGERSSRLAIAKKMKEKKLDNKLIEEITGVMEEEIEKL